MKPRKGTLHCKFCERRHRSWFGIAKCRWPRATWIGLGDGFGLGPIHSLKTPEPGPFALLLLYPAKRFVSRGFTVTLWANRSAAVECIERLKEMRDGRDIYKIVNLEWNACAACYYGEPCVSPPQLVDA